MIYKPTNEKDTYETKELFNMFYLDNNGRLDVNEKELIKLYELYNKTHVNLLYVVDYRQNVVTISKDTIDIIVQKPYTNIQIMKTYDVMENNKFKRRYKTNESI